MLIDDLRRTKEILLEKGWCQKNTWNGTQVCLIGAAAFAANGENLHGGTKYSNIIYALSRALSISSNGIWGTHNLTRYNDYQCKSIDDVVALIDKAILEEIKCQDQNSILKKDITNTSSMELSIPV